LHREYPKLASIIAQNGLEKQIQKKPEMKGDKPWEMLFNGKTI
jgi:hypothetical protein